MPDTYIACPFQPCWGMLSSFCAAGDRAAAYDVPTGLPAPCGMLCFAVVRFTALGRAAQPRLSFRFVLLCPAVGSCFWTILAFCLLTNAAAYARTHFMLVQQLLRLALLLALPAVACCCCCCLCTLLSYNNPTDHVCSSPIAEHKT